MPPLPIEPPPTKSLLRRVFQWKYAVLIFLATIITLLEGYPWLSVERGEVLDPRNPYSEMFDARNGGYVPITNLDALCSMKFTDSRGNEFDSLNTTYPTFASYLGHDGRITIPCFRSLATEGVQIMNGAELTVTIYYAMYHFNLSFLRKSQKFRFKAIVGKDGSHHWQFL